MAHATHPNYPEKHEPDHPVRMNGGPAIKSNVNQRYASESESEAVFLAACERADVPCQRYVHRGDLPCGSTIGPLTAANLGIRTVDVGNPQLAMHSARELCGARDPSLLARALEAFFECARARDGTTMPERPAPQVVPDCNRCRAFFVTHDALRPYGCRTFGFQSQRLPRDEVRLSSGQECAAFEARPGRPGSPPARPTRS
jgi:hypothetical protein